ncbi:MAG: hypothetical protein ACREFP_23015 [Acetobacteraceae bacterium]
MTADAGVCFVEDRPGGEQRLCCFEGALHRQQVSVLQDHLQGGDPGIGAQHEEPVVPGVGADLGDRRVMRHGGFRLRAIGGDVFNLRQHAAGDANGMPAVFANEDLFKPTRLSGNDDGIQRALARYWRRVHR